MGEWNITLVEYHSHDEGIQLFPEIFTPAEADEREPAPEEETEDDANGGRNGLAMVAVLVILIGLAAAVRHYRKSDEDEPIVESREVEVTEYED